MGMLMAMCMRMALIVSVRLANDKIIKSADDAFTRKAEVFQMLFCRRIMRDEYIVL